MHVVQIEDFVHPDSGYQISVLSKYFAKFGHQVTIITAEMDRMPDYLTSFFGKDHMEERDRAYEREYGVKIIRVPMWKYVSGRAIFSKPLLPLVRSLKPDVLFVHGSDTLTGMWALWNRKKLGCPLIMDNHMSVLASRNPMQKYFRSFYRHVFTPIIRKDRIKVIEMSDERYAHTSLGVPSELAPLISFGSDTMLFHPDSDIKNAFHQEHRISPDAFVVLYAGKMDESKGGQFLADLTCQKLNTEREVVYVIVGNTVGDYGKKVEETFGKSPYRVLRFPTQKYCDLPRFFQAADLALLPRQGSLSLFDLNATGVPVLVEGNYINQQRCQYHNGWTFEPENLTDFKEQLEHVLSLPEEDLASYRVAAQQYILEQYSYEHKAREYEQLILETAARTGTKM